MRFGFPDWSDLPSVPGKRNRIPKSSGKRGLTRARRAQLRRSLRAESLEPRQMMAADSIGVTPLNTAEFLLGSVTVTPVFFESDGTLDPNTQDWTEEEIDQTLAKITEGVTWWDRLLERQNTVHSLDFVIDDTFARTPVSTIYEPIDNTSETFQRYVGTFLAGQGYGDAPSLERAVQLFNDQKRIEHETDWAFTIFVADSSDDPDGFFSGQGFFSGAFAFPGGLFVVSPSGRPASTFAHELGHIFWARDEYRGGGNYTDQRGYYNAQNINAWDNPTAGFVQQVSIMRGGVIAQEAYDTFATPDSTLELLGWRDSDGNGVFDVLDVPLALDAVGYSDPTNSQFHLVGSASAVTMRNVNSSGIQSDITLNRVREIQYRLDGGDWMTAAEFDAPQVDFDLSVTIADAYSEIQWRAVDTSTGIASAVLSGQSGSHVFSAGVGGIAFVDDNQNGIYDANEMLLANTHVTILDANSEPLFGGVLAAADLPQGDLHGQTVGVELTAEGASLDGTVGAFDSVTGPANSNFQSFDLQLNRWTDRWGEFRTLNAAFDQPVAKVSVTVGGLNTGSYGVRDGSYGRVEAYDSNGNLIHRVASPLIPDGQYDVITIEDSAAAIASIKVYGHAETEVTVTQIEFGFEDQWVTDSFGAWPAVSLPSGEYQFQLEADNIIYQWPGGIVPFEVAPGGGVVSAAAQRVDSFRHNEILGEDVNGEDGITALDALNVINDLSRNGTRTLRPDEIEGEDVDVNNDGNVSALDALLVINKLEVSGGEGEQTASSARAGGFFRMGANQGAEGIVGSESLNPGAASDFLDSTKPTAEQESDSISGDSIVSLPVGGSGQTERGPAQPDLIQAVDLTLAQWLGSAQNLRIAAIRGEGEFTEMFNSAGNTQRTASTPPLMTDTELVNLTLVAGNGHFGSQIPSSGAIKNEESTTESDQSEESDQIPASINPSFPSNFSEL